MASFLTYKFIDSPEFINTFDEAPLWSARFGFLLLDNLDLKPGMTVLDVGSGAGFPLIELAERLGESSKVYGIDPWTNANNRTRQKVEQYEITHLEIIEQRAENIPFENNFFDLITANLGINNFENRDTVFQECFRLLKPGGKLVITTNLLGHWKEFYKIFEQTLVEIGNDQMVHLIKEEEEHRGTMDTNLELFRNNGFRIVKYIEDSFTMKFVNGTAFLNHHFVKCGWLESWFDLFPEEDKTEIFKTLEQYLNKYAIEQNGLKLTVPMAYIEGEK